MRGNTQPAIVTLGVLLLLLPGSANDVAAASAAMRDDETLLLACVDSCGIPAGWTVESGLFELSDTWGDPWPCGEGMEVCPPGDPLYGWSFVCMPSPDMVP
jgi:hypothetical protein